MTFLNELLTGHSIIDESFIRNNAGIAGLVHDTIFASYFEIWTATNKTGTKLVLNTDYILVDVDPCLSGEVGETVYTKLSIINPAFFSVQLYATYKTAGDYNDAGDVNSLRSDLTTAQSNISTLQNDVLFNSATQTITANYNALITDKTILINTNNSITLGVPTGLPIGFKLALDRISSGLTVNGVNLSFTGETLNGLTNVTIFGNSLAKTRKDKEYFEIQKVAGTIWEFVAGDDSGLNANGYFSKKYNRRLTVKCPATYVTSVADSSIAVPLPVQPFASNYEVPVAIGCVPVGGINPSVIAYYENGNIVYRTNVAGNYLAFEFENFWF